MRLAPVMVINPVVVPFWADPFVWGVAGLGMAAEIAVVQQLLRRHGDVTPHSAGPLFVANACTFTLFVLSVGLFDEGTDAAIWGHDLWLEGVVVLLECQILGWLARTGRVFRDRARVTLTVRQALSLSIHGNLTSIAVSLVGATFVGMVLAALSR